MQRRPWIKMRKPLQLNMTLSHTCYRNSLMDALGSLTGLAPQNWILSRTFTRCICLYNQFVMTFQFGWLLQRGSYSKRWPENDSLYTSYEIAVNIYLHKPIAFISLSMVSVFRRWHWVRSMGFRQLKLWNL